MAADLVCSKCGTAAVGDLALVAKPGGTHFVKHRGERGRNSDSFYRATSCGTWVEKGKEKERDQ